MTDKKIFGNRGEMLAKTYLIKRGYTFIAQNYKSGRKEIDLIFKYREKLIFIEVKTRLKNLFDLAVNHLSSKQKNNLQSALIDYCLKKRWPLEETRLDLIIILANKETNRAELKHYLDIF